MNLLEKMLSSENINEINLNMRYEELETNLDAMNKNDAILFMKELFKYNLQILRKKQRIKVAFVTYSSSEWRSEGLYRIMEKDPRFEPTIAVCGYAHGTSDSIRRTYVNTCEYFRKKKTYNVEYLGFNNRFVECDRLDGYDIIIYPIHYRNAMVPQGANMIRRKISTLIIYISYSYTIVEPETNYVDESPIFKMCWKCCAADYMVARFFSEKERLEGYNIIVSGLPTENENKSTEKAIWKGEAKRKIIWAPHFNIKRGMNGTFNENYLWFYKYASEHPEYSWVVKPHPRLEWGTITYGVFSNEQEYLEYLEKWNSLCNAKVIEGGDFKDYFRTSDMLIHDSLSFMDEYMRTGNAQLRLVPELQRPLNYKGQALAKHIPHVRGNDFLEISRFIDCDWGKQREYLSERKIFLKQELGNEAEKENITSGEYIMKEIIKEIYG